MKKLSLKTLTFLACFGLSSVATAAYPPPTPPGDGPPAPPGDGGGPPPPPGDDGAPPLPPGQQTDTGDAKPPAPPGAVSNEQKNAEEVLYKQGKYDEASIVFHKIIAEEAQGDAQRAQFWLGKSLFNQGFYSASLSMFGSIVDAGPQHAYHQVTLPWLASLSRVLPEGAGVLERVGSYKPADLEREEFDEVRDELYYLLGRFYYQKADLPQAIALLSQVPEPSDFYIPAQYFLGVAETREYHGPEAVEAFKNVLRKNIKLKEELNAGKKKKKKKMSKAKKKKLGISDVELDFEEQNQRFEELANIALGFIFYQVGKFEVGIKYFDRVPPQSPYWLDAVFAAAWSEFRMVEVDAEGANRHYQRTLGYIHTLNAPFFYDYLYPEALILKAVSYYFNCRYAPAKQAVEEFRERYIKTKDDLQSVLDSAPEDFELFELTVKIRESTSELEPFVEKVARKSLQDKTLEKFYAYVARMEFEQELFEKQSSAFQGATVGDFVAETLDLTLSLAKETAGSEARKRLTQQIKEIKKLEREAIKVDYEIVEKLKKVGEDNAGDIQKPLVDKEHEIYNYNGEYWQDELGYYNYQIVSVCQE